MPRRIEGRPSTGGLPPTERIKGWGGRIPKRRHRVIDLFTTGEGQGADATKPIDPDKLAEEIKQIARFGRKARKDTRRH